MTMAHAVSPSPSPFPETPVALSRPDHAAVRSLNYDNYNQAFSEDTSYSNSYNSSALTPTRPSPQSVFGNKVLSVISENVKAPGVVATACSLSRKASFHARAKSLGAKSFASFVPSLNPTTTEERAGSASPPRKNRTLGDIFTTPRRASLAPSEEDQESEFIMPYKSSFTGGPGREPEPQPQSAPKPASGIRSFSWFASKPTPPPSGPAVPLDSTMNVDLLGSPSSLLFPLGSSDPSAPNSFNELLQNAEFLIGRLQTAYKEQAAVLHTARAEREAQAEETEESSTRARHLKSQLEEMAAKVADQDVTNRALAEELAAEKQRRHEDREHFERLARQNDVTPTRRSRHSGASSISDSGFESEADTASSCSRPITPTSPHIHNYSFVNDRWGNTMEPIKEVRPVSRDSQTARMPSRTCEVDAGVWAFMREEKLRLERRVSELEGALDGCLDLIA